MFLFIAFVHLTLTVVELFVFNFCCFFVLYVEFAPKPLFFFGEIRFGSNLGIFLEWFLCF